MDNKSIQENDNDKDDDSTYPQDMKMLLWSQPRVTIQMLSQFIKKLPLKYKEKIWKRQAEARFIPKSKVLDILYTFAFLCIKWLDKTAAVKASKVEVTRILSPSACSIKQRIENPNGVSLDEFKNKLHIWVLTPFQLRISLPLLWENPRVTIQMVSEFMQAFPLQHKEKIWQRYTTEVTGRYITKNKILSVLYSYTSLAITIKDRTSAVHPSEHDVEQKLIPFARAARQKIQSENGMSFDEFNNQLHLWILQYFQSITNEQIEWMQSIIFRPSNNDQKLNCLVDGYVKYIDQNSPSPLIFIIMQYLGNIFFRFTFTASMLSEFIEFLSMEKKKQIWDICAKEQYIEKEQILQILVVFAKLYMKHIDKEAVIPSSKEIKKILLPYSECVLQQIVNSNGISFDQFTNKLHFWILDPVSNFFIGSRKVND